MQPRRKSKFDLPQGDLALAQVAERYAVSVTDAVMETIDSANPADPVARQYLPSAEELKTTPDELDDPIGDDVHSPVKGIVHRYPDRVLLKPVHVCAVYCRFCFRREKVGPGSEALSKEELQKAIAYIRNTKEIWEVILTGGDPFVLSPRRLRDIMDALNEIPHVQVIRFHTRVPVADPSRVTDELVQALHSEKAVYIVLHANHARELTVKVREATRKFIAAGIPLLSQSTLLRGVNDDAAVLEELFRALTAMKIKPYYLHHPDLAPGTSHFRLSIARGRGLVEKIWGRLSGIAQPSYVLDIPGGFGKVPAGGEWLQEDGEGYAVTDYQGGKHRYKDS
ncbi:MAG: lysine-2,3-aminomutase-like protein [Alphaproteobacteria bacterium]|nr:MAG: lysine-2,3-aminomutase-like protein [Alphaproteobacteria bacterium]